MKKVIALLLALVLTVGMLAGNAVNFAQVLAICKETE